MRQLEMAEIPARAQSILERLPAGPLVGAEIGVKRGELSRVLLTVRPDLTLYMVDLWRHNPSPEYRATRDNSARMARWRWPRLYLRVVNRFAAYGSRAVMLRADSVEAAARIADASLDFVFIDDDHSFSGCSRSLAAWFPKVKPGGLFSGHDYQHLGLQFRFRVTEAVDAFCAQRGLTVETGLDYTWFVKVP
jgi:hypothetical protein